MRALVCNATDQVQDLGQKILGCLGLIRRTRVLILQGPWRKKKVSESFGSEPVPCLASFGDVDHEG